MELKKARQVAWGIIEELTPYCERVIVGGSIRREKAQVKDIEIVLIPRMVTEQVDLFGGTREFSALDGIIYRLVNRMVLRWDDAVKRRGEKYKRLIHNASGMVVELFAAQPENWGLILTLRTGPGEFNKVLVNRFGGAMPSDMEMRGGFLWRRGERLETPTERVFFEEVGVPFWVPEERTAERLREWLVGGRGL